MSKIKRRALSLIGPNQVTVLGVFSIGVGLGMSKDVVKKTLSDGSGPLVEQDPPTQPTG